MKKPGGFQVLLFAALAMLHAAAGASKVHGATSLRGMAVSTAKDLTRLGRDPELHLDAPVQRGTSQQDSNKHAHKRSLWVQAATWPSTAAAGRLADSPSIYGQPYDSSESDGEQADMLQSDSLDGKEAPSLWMQAATYEQSQAGAAGAGIADAK